ncbi:MAG: FAD-dependent oxidoreductase [Nanoarchaeota archaeon]|nr:MAG: FAD-dependent oxidoreductase [Nanoarchaeota archaeon]
MPSYKVKLLSKRQIADGTMEFNFEKPVDFIFKAGHHARLNLFNIPNPDEKGTSRQLSIVSAPEENKISYATRIRDSSFKKYLAEMPIGTDAEIKNPHGDFILPEGTDRLLVFLAGGIGITPFMSMLRHLMNKNLPYKITFFFSNRKETDAPYLAELKSIKNPNVQVITTMTADTNWQGNKGYIGEQMIKKYVPNPKNAIFYISGPPVFVDAMQQLAQKLGAKDIKTDEFEGY